MNTMTVAAKWHNPMRRIRRIHFVGIGGVGMCGIAEVLSNLGYCVSGSDWVESANTAHLAQLGVNIMFGHVAGHVHGADVVVASTAVSADNPELEAARKARLPIVSRAEMLAELMRFRQGIAVAGTHGKTTTTSLIASLLAEAGLDPTFVIGGKLNSANSNARLGDGTYLVAEADESDASFLHLQPVIAVVTNIDAEHLGTYGGDFDGLKRAFIDFIHHLPFYGMAVLCLDDPVIREILPEITRPVLTYALHHDADIRAEQVTFTGAKSEFSVALPDTDATPLSLTLAMPGEHNVQNALAAIAVAHELGVEAGAIQRGLSTFAGIGRRFQIYHPVSLAGITVTLVDDYGHHPNEIAATLAAARNAWPERRLVLAFQPHRYSRTRDLFEDFTEVLSTVDVLLLTEVYAAGESAISGADGRALARAIRARGRVNPVFVKTVAGLPAALAAVVNEGDLLLMLGAGDIGKVAHTIATASIEGEKKGA